MTARYPKTELSTAEDLALQEIARWLLPDARFNSHAAKREAFKREARAAFADRIPQIPQFEAIITTTFEQAADAYYTLEPVS